MNNKELLADNFVKNERIYESMKTIFSELRDNINRGNFRSEKEKNDLFKLKSDFLDLLKSLFQNKEIYDMFNNWIGSLLKINDAKNISLSDMQTVCNSLEIYFKKGENKVETIKKVVQPSISSVFKVDRKEKVVEEKKISNSKSEKIKIEKQKKSNGREKIGKILGVTNLGEKNCYELFEDFSWGKYNKEDLDKIFSDLKDFIRLRESNGNYENLSFVKFLIRDIKGHLDLQKVASDKKVENYRNKEAKDVLNKIFVDNLSIFKEFIIWFDCSVIDVVSISSIDELKLDHEKYIKFIEFRKNFFDKFRENIFEKYKKEFETNNKINYSDYSFILRGISILSDLYSELGLSEKNFFLGIKRGFLLGDIYDFLDKMIKNNPEIIQGFDTFLLKKLEKYNS
ncbi:hypothetical protein K9M48_05445 [Candidatus Gracilibacteria bacterium]|nr:hypothetical protein [Candidatus Gracilibacteria bacterium]